MEYKFLFNNKEYILNEEKCEGIFFSSEDEVSGLTLDTILSALNEGEEVDFSKEYYCGKCICDKQEELNKAYCYLEFHFYIYTKDNEYVINTLSKEYEDTNFNKLYNAGKVDDSYIVNVTVCPECGTYSVEVDQCEV